MSHRRFLCPRLYSLPTFANSFFKMSLNATPLPDSPFFYHLPYFFHYRILLILIMPPTSSFSYSHYIIHTADKLIIKHSFNLSFATRRLQWLHSLLEATWRVLRVDLGWPPLHFLPTALTVQFIDTESLWALSQLSFPDIGLLLKPILLAWTVLLSACVNHSHHSSPHCFMKSSRFRLA